VNYNMDAIFPFCAEAAHMHQPSSLPEDFIPIDNAFVAKQREPEFHSR